MKTIITISIASILSLVAIISLSHSKGYQGSFFQNDIVNLNRKKVAEVLRHMNETKLYRDNEKSLYTVSDTQAF